MKFNPRKNVTALTILYLLSFIPSAALAGEKLIYVVKAMDIGPYNLVLKGFKESVKREANSVVFKEAVIGKGDVVQEIRSLNPALILTIGEVATEKVTREIKDVPIVFSVVLYPEELGIEGKNVTGISFDIPVEKQFEKLKEIMPEKKRVGVIYTKKQNEGIIGKARSVIQGLGFKLKEFPIEYATEIPHLKEAGIDVLWVIPDSIVCQPSIIRKLLSQSLECKVPVFGLSPHYVRAGALAALFGDYEDIGRQTGETALRVLEGESPGEIPVSPPRKVRVYLNLAVSRAVGVEIPQSVIREAEEVFGE